MFARAPARRWLFIVCLAVVLLWYPTLTWLLGFPPSRHLDFGLAFNSMAEHLLAGRFDVDPDAIGGEAFDVNGRAVSYFGIFCALLRIPLVLTPGLARTDVTWWSCLIAVWFAAFLQLRAIFLIWPMAASSRQSWLAVGLLISIVLGGQYIQFLRPSIYQEPINWAFAQSMAFVLLAIQDLDRTAPGETAVRGMAVCAGLALLTRVSFGVGLYMALGLFLCARGQVRSWVAPVGILLAFVVMAGIVNDGRWGNPFTFADFSRYDLSQDLYPDRLARLAAYGAFNPVRIWLGLSYYFLPIWIWIRPDGHVLFAEAQARLMDVMELPPGSFLLTDPLLLGLAAIGVLSIRDRARAALLLGLCVPPVLMLCAISMAHRYRMEFYPLLFLAALFGVAARPTRAETTRMFRAAVIGSIVIGVVASHAEAVLTARSPFGPGEFYLERSGLVGTYEQPP